MKLTLTLNFMIITPYLHQAETQALQFVLYLSQTINAKQPSQGRKRR